MHEGFTWIDTVVLVLYLVGVLLAGLYFSKKEMKGKEFFKGDGTIPWWVTCVSIFATLLSPISFLSLPGNSYKGSWILWWAQLGMLIAIPLTIKYFLPIYSRLEIDTAYHYLQKRFESKNLRILGASMFIIYQLGRMSIIMYLPSIALAELTGIDVNILIVVMGVIAIIYSYSGGLKAVLYTDFIQGMVLIFGIALTLVVMIGDIHGGFGTIMDTLTTGHKFMFQNEVWMSPDILSTSVFIVFIGGGLATFASYVSSQDIVQRFTTTTDIKQLNKMTLGNGALSIFAATVFYLVGTSLYVFYQQNPDLLMTSRQDLVFATYITYELPAGITGILLAAIYAASQSPCLRASILSPPAGSSISSPSSTRTWTARNRRASPRSSLWASASCPSSSPWSWPSATSTRPTNGSTASSAWPWARWPACSSWAPSASAPMPKAHSSASSALRPSSCI